MSEAQRLTVDFSRYPALSAEELAVLMMTDEEFAAVIEREQEEADQGRRGL